VFWIRRYRHRLAASVLFLILSTATGWGKQSPAVGKINSKASFEELSTNAAALRDAGKVSEAIKSYKAALDIRPDWNEGWWYLGTLNYDADHYGEAIVALQKLVELDPELGPAWAFLGLSEFETRDYKNSLAHLQNAHQRGYGDDNELAKVAKYHLAVLFNFTGEYEKSLELFGSDATRVQVPDQIKVVLGMSLLRIPLLPNEVDPGKDALIHTAGDAAAMLASGNQASAAEMLRKLLQDDPKTPYLHYALAAVLVDSGKTTDALTELDQETKITPASPLPYIRMASIHSRQGDLKAALAAAQQAVRISPNSPIARESLAKVLQDLGKTEDATNELQAAKQLRASPAGIDQNQQRLYTRVLDREASPSPTGKQPQSPVNTGTPSDFESLARKAASAQAANQTGAAITYYQQALALRADWEEGWRGLGTLYLMTARYPDAVGALKNASSINPNVGDVWALLGLAEFETRDYNNALIHLQRGRDLGFSGNAAAVQIANYRLAILLNRNGEFDHATELLTPGSGSGPVKEQTKFALGMALLRIPRLPDEIDSASEPLVRSAGETAASLVESKYDQAFSQFQELLKKYPNTPYLHYAYATALTSASQFDEAERQLLEEARINPKSALPYRRRTAIALQLRQPEKALQLALQAAQLDSESGEGHYLLGRSWLDTGKADNAVQELEKARDRVPNSPEVHFALARAYSKAGMPEQAERERGTFERLNVAVQRQRSTRGSQAYGQRQDQNGIQTAEGAQSADHRD
jgi:tetratricopeptide (TPR) repeat protein